MNTVVGALTNSTTGITADTFFQPIAGLVPWLVIVIPAALGVYFLRKAIKGAGKAKVKL